MCGAVWRCVGIGDIKSPVYPYGWDARCGDCFSLEKKQITIISGGTDAEFCVRAVICLYDTVFLFH